jgi:predicted Zn-ribbon and HTH transcriptional regulator
MASESGSGTHPQRLREALRGAEPKTAKELSRELSIGEKEVAAALEKLGRSLEHGPLQLRIEPARCLACGFEFRERSRVSRPSRCPQCRAERIAPARFSIPDDDAEI